MIGMSSPVAARRALVRLGIVALAALPCAAFADPSPEELRGVKNVGVMVEDLPAGADRCDVTKTMLESAARRVIDSTGLHIAAKQDSDGYLYVNVNVIYAKPIDYCAFSVALRFNTFGDARTRYGEGYFEMTLFDRTAVGIFRRYRAAHEIDNVVGQLVKDFVETWSRANAPRVPPEKRAARRARTPASG